MRGTKLKKIRKLMKTSGLDWRQFKTIYRNMKRGYRNIPFPNES